MHIVNWVAQRSSGVLNIKTLLDLKFSFLGRVDIRSALCAVVDENRTAGLTDVVVVVMLDLYIVQIDHSKAGLTDGQDRSQKVLIGAEELTHLEILSVDVAIATD